MNRSDLIKTLSATLGKTDVKELAALYAINEPDISPLFELTFYPQREVAFRAAWTLELIVLNYPECFRPLLKEFLDRYPDQNNQSCQRHFTRIMMCLTDSKGSAAGRLFSDENTESIIGKTFEWLIDPNTPVAVQANCIDVLFNLRGMLPWIAEELRSQIVFLLHNGSPALQSRGKAVLKKLERKLLA